MRISEFSIRESFNTYMVDLLEEVTFEEWVDGVDNIDEVKDRMIEDLDEKKFEFVENAIIYYHECVQIVEALHYFSNWNENELGMEINSICDVAFVALYEFINEEGLLYDVVDGYIDNNKNEIEQAIAQEV